MKFFFDRKYCYFEVVFVILFTAIAVQDLWFNFIWLLYIPVAMLANYVRDKHQLESTTINIHAENFTDEQLDEIVKNIDKKLR